MMRKLSALGMGAALALVLGASTAHAAAITGSVSFGGTFKPTGGTGLKNATGVDIVGDAAVVTCAISATCTGTYAGVTGAVLAQYHDFQFNPLGGSISPLWRFVFGGNTYTFDLSSVTIVTQTAKFLDLSGSGTLFLNGGSATTASWSFSGDSSGRGLFAFSSTATAVPEPASALLFGMALIGGARAYRRRA